MKAKEPVLEVSGRVVYMALGAVLATIFLTRADAGVLQGDRENCSYFGAVVEQLAEYRDQGIGWDEARQATELEIQAAMGQPTSIVMDDSDAAYIRSRVGMIWHEYRMLTPETVRRLLEGDCNGSPGKTT